VKIGDLVMKRSNLRELAGIGIVIMVANDAAVDRHQARYKIQWSNNYGTFWAPENDVKVVSENR